MISQHERNMHCGVEGWQAKWGGTKWGRGRRGGGQEGVYLLEGLRQALVLLGNLKHQLLVLAVLLLHLRHILLERLDQVQVVVRDVIVVVLDV